MKKQKQDDDDANAPAVEVPPPGEVKTEADVVQAFEDGYAKGRAEAEARLADEQAQREQQMHELREAAEGRNPSADKVNAFWDGYESALRATAHRADGTEYVGRGGQTLSQALHEADVQRKARLAEAQADEQAATK